MRNYISFALQTAPQAQQVLLVVVIVVPAEGTMTISN
jgi:hypothetical protein